ncbi:hypothetical protein LCX93_10490 [Sulfurimonas sp. SWIR-19]|uniref:hypothetical protein n=1 Tax=Sulfurimonas sp. SWIR-19 TaxID=2878390 RepID=UPI001CF55C78|nr:hypothetical protein [Sulfurimonas sp. SWIR-19]UCM99939.1 hypothetical protein LCX93_10490 [Sulfurimonas sp. SWIR-19]
MIKNLFKRIKSQKGMSGVLVALLLVIVGVGLVAGVSTFLNNQVNTIQTSANTAINNAVTNASATN